MPYENDWPEDIKHKVRRVPKAEAEKILHDVPEDVTAEEERPELQRQLREDAKHEAHGLDVEQDEED